MKSFLRFLTSAYILVPLVLTKIMNLPTHVSHLLFSILPIIAVLIDMQETGITIKKILGNRRRAIPLYMSLFVILVCLLSVLQIVPIIPNTIHNATQFQRFASTAVVLAVAFLSCINFVITVKDVTRHNQNRPLY